MKLIQINTYQHVKVGQSGPQKFFQVTGDKSSLGRVEGLTPHQHEKLGPGVIVETADMAAKGQVAFVSVTNIELAIFAKEDVAGPKKAK